MATQQILFAETIAGMKKAFKRKAYESDSDSEIEAYTNRGHKLQKRARFARKGQLVPNTGPSAYKELVDYAGVRRAILYRNPPLVDDEGYELDSEDGDERLEDAEVAAAELNPYSNIRLEDVLAPLTASTDLPTHPTLSKPFTSKTLTGLISQSCGIMRKENQSLWQVRHLWTSLCGDGVWLPCETMVGPNDMDLFSDEHVARYLQSLSKGDATDDPAQAEVNGDSTKGEQKQDKGDVPMKDASNPTEDEQNTEAESKPQRVADSRRSDGELATTAQNSSEGADGKRQADPKSNKNGEKNGIVSESDTQADLAKAVNSAASVASEASAQPFIHPMYRTPAGAKPDRDMGLPEHEAEDIRRLLALYVQKQEEVCRGASKLHHGLLRAERLRHNVLHWAKAEAHCGVNRDLSDGEDWYDKEEWGLTEDLKKGQDEEEEDTTTTGKKTRARRA